MSVWSLLRHVGEVAPWIGGGAGVSFLKTQRDWMRCHFRQWLSPHLHRLLSRDICPYIFVLLPRPRTDPIPPTPPSWLSTCLLSKFLLPFSKVIHQFFLNNNVTVRWTRTATILSGELCTFAYSVYENCGTAVHKSQRNVTSHRKKNTPQPPPTKIVHTLFDWWGFMWTGRSGGSAFAFSQRVSARFHEWIREITARSPPSRLRRPLNTENIHLKSPYICVHSAWLDNVKVRCEGFRAVQQWGLICLLSGAIYSFVPSELL